MTTESPTGDVELIDLDPEPGCGTKKPVARKSCSQFQNTLTSSSADPEAKSDEKTGLKGSCVGVEVKKGSLFHRTLLFLLCL